MTTTTIRVTHGSAVSRFVPLFAQLVLSDLDWARPIEQNLIWTQQTEEDATCLESSHQTWRVADVHMRVMGFNKQQFVLKKETFKWTTA